MGHHSYSRFAPAKDEPTGVSFDLDDVHFECLPKLPAGAVYDLGGFGSGTYRAVEFIRGCIASEADANLFMEELRRRDLIAEPALLDQMLRDLMADYTGRPSMPSEESVPGASSTPGSSAGGSDSPASTPTTT
jgi:hypothetical protein